MLAGVIPDSLVTGMLDILRQSGTVGAIAAAIIIALTLSLIIFARSKGLWEDFKARDQSIQLQDRMLAMIDKLSASEEAMRRKIEEMSRENGAMRDEVDELRASLALLRNQRRKLIEYLRQVRDSTHAGPKGSAA